MNPQPRSVCGAWRSFGGSLMVAALLSMSGCARHKATYLSDLTPDALLHFESGDTRVSAEQENVVQEVVTRLQMQPATKALIVGHADSTGSTALNDEIAKERAQRVAALITDRDPKLASRVLVASYGENNPVANNGTSYGRAQNRRVNVHYYRPDQLADESQALQTSFGGRLRFHGRVDFQAANRESPAK